MVFSLESTWFLSLVIWANCCRTSPRMLLSWFFSSLSSLRVFSDYTFSFLSLVNSTFNFLDSSWMLLVSSLFFSSSESDDFFSWARELLEVFSCPWRVAFSCSSLLFASFRFFNNAWLAYSFLELSWIYFFSLLISAWKSDFSFVELTFRSWTSLSNLSRSSFSALKFA